MLNIVLIVLHVLAIVINRSRRYSLDPRGSLGKWKCLAVGLGETYRAGGLLV